jgi:hypothetical protein
MQFARRQNRGYVGQLVESDAKRCTKCNRTLPLSAFNKANKTSSGFESCCSLCATLWRLYKLSHAEYMARYEAQQGLCAICRRPGAVANRADRLAVDHNHQTGEVRGLLCGKCNAAIAYLLESPAILQRAVAYLEQYNGLEGPSWQE